MRGGGGKGEGALFVTASKNISTGKGKGSSKPLVLVFAGELVKTNPGKKKSRHPGIGALKADA